MGMTYVMQSAHRILDLSVDPCCRAICRRCGAFLNNPIKGQVETCRKFSRFQRLGKRSRQMKAVKRQYAALFGFNPVNLGCIPVVRHRENALCIGLEQQSRVNGIGHEIWFENSRFWQSRHELHNIGCRLIRRFFHWDMTNFGVNHGL